LVSQKTENSANSKKAGKERDLRRDWIPPQGPVRGTTRTLRHMDVDDRVPVPTMLTETLVGDPHPAVMVLLPLSPGATLTIVSAGAAPLPVQARLTEMCVLSTMLKPVIDTLLTVLTALKLNFVPVLFGL